MSEQSVSRGTTRVVLATYGARARRCESTAGVPFDFDYEPQAFCRFCRKRVEAGVCMGPHMQFEDYDQLGGPRCPYDYGTVMARAWFHANRRSSATNRGALIHHRRNKEIRAEHDQRDK